ncbi:CAZyme family GH18 [Penicillium brevicompactum]|uniref:CAZyme family GH18 n=1 Tax=Penicillium brevicompactum TaxID=5074 RepID=UPI00253F8F5F|nr:CAZyme family GH18 [Penicillium brevicompactum]KAJ5344046.1 CAZyme family GH18 [Penicillium brevicompactum]
MAIQLCGYDPDKSCGSTCVSNCNATAECGKWAATAGTTCPLNVCCSEFGFCGTTSEFCNAGTDGGKCQSNCYQPTQPSCKSNDVLKKVIGYYESWSAERTCDSWSPSNLPVQSLTHIYWSFALFKPWNDGWNVYLMDEDKISNLNDMVADFIALKDDNPSLKCFLSVGGWSFNDGDSAHYWSDMASTESGRKSFAKDLLRTLQQYGFDGVDLDWEYPVASDRGGSKDDMENYGKLIKQVRSTFDDSGSSLGISFTIPSSYWYLRHFDVPAYLQEDGADWANMMTYDLHGVWDGTDPYIGNITGAHTNLTEIQQSMDLLWRNNVDPSKIVLGIGFYGRSFTLKDSSCTGVGCPFTGGGQPGRCTDASGILSYNEIMEIVENVDVQGPIWEETAAVMYVTWDDNQWVSYDNNVTMKQKVDWANDHCLGGVMIWALDQDTYDWQALTALLNKDVSSASLLEGGSENSLSAKALAHAYNQYTGTDCYVTGCVDYNSGSCKAGYSVLDYVHRASYGTITDPDDHLCKTGDTTEYEDSDSEYRLICCPTDAMPTCQWTGGSSDGMCTGGKEKTCGSNEFEIVKDSYSDRTGSTPCMVNSRSLCCATDPNLDTIVNSCFWTACNGECMKTDIEYPEYALKPGTNLNEDSEYCSGSEVSTFCCPFDNGYENCEWTTCTESCASDKVLLTQRSALLNGSLPQYCQEGGMYKFCCDAPTPTVNPPVDPSAIFEYPDEKNYSYYLKHEDTDNNESSDFEQENPYAFVMVDGDTDAYDESLVDQWTFLEDGGLNSKRDGGPRKKRDIFTFREDTFDNVVETYIIRCASLDEDTGCKTIFSGGASNTIVKMPSYHGSGPYARVISLVPQHSSEKRSNILPRDTNQAYELTVDYDLASASEEEKGDVNFRVDYTNLLDYWEDITEDPPQKRKRWFGAFKQWLKKVTTIVKNSSGYLPLNYYDTIKLFHWDEKCSGKQMSLDIDSTLDIGLNAQYAYYFEGAILPTPKLISSYAYFSVAPAAEILLTMRGEAAFQTSSDKIDIISGVTFPGLSIKGLISIGPELALSGKMDASMVVSGELNAGVVVEFPKAEVFFPQDSDGEDASVPPSSLKNEDGKDAPNQFSVTPQFEASASASGNLALTLTPEVKFGISVLNGKLMEGYVTAGVENTVSLGVSASASTGLSSGSSAEFCYWADYDYSVFLQADASFLGDVAYWGDRYEIASPEDPIALVDKKCLAYSSDLDEKRKRDSASSALVKNTTGSPFFSGWCQCANKNTQLTNETLSCLDTEDTSSTAKRANTAPTCYLPPALFYNCDWFPTTRINNLNTDTNGQTPHVDLRGICENVKKYLDRNSGKQYVWPNWMRLTYQPDPTHANRVDACTQKSKECTKLKRSLWPKDGKQPQALTMSCDEFPFNSAAEGGTGAEVACVPDGQQKYQAKINGQLSYIKYTPTGQTASKYWKDSSWTGPTRYYTMNLFSYTNTQNNLGTVGGIFSSGATNNPSMNPGTGLLHVLGGINLQGNPELSLTNNGICLVYPYKKKAPGALKVDMLESKPCKIQFEPPATIAARGLDPNDPDNWVVTNVTLSDDPFEEDSPFKEMADQLNEIGLAHDDDSTEPEFVTAKRSHSHHHGSHRHHI